MDVARPWRRRAWGCSVTAAERAREYARNGASDRADAEPPPRAHGRRAADLISEILDRASEPWVPIKLGCTELIQVRAGGIVVVMGPTGAGKSSLVCGMLVSHASEQGPVVVLSRELPGDQLAARIIGMQVDSSWPDVLKGNVPRETMERVLSTRLLVLERRDATLADLDREIRGIKLECPGEPILVAIDYLQILESNERETRAKVTDIIAKIDELARAHRVVVIAISQMSRASSRAARNGETVGADSTDGGAESAAIERAASVTLSIGSAGPERDDETCAVEVSIGKSRMGGGDRVLPMSYCGRSGRWRLDGESRAAADVRAERAGEKGSARQRNAELAIAAVAGRADEPQTRADLGQLAGVGSAPLRTAAIKALLDRGELVQVRRRASARGAAAWKLWTRERAQSAGIEIIEWTASAAGSAV